MQTNPRLKKLKLRKDQIEARIKNLEARDKSREKKRDTRRKILIGAFYLEQMEKDDTLKKKILSRLDGFLVRENDRELFGLGGNVKTRSRPDEAQKNRTTKTSEQKST